MAHKHITIKSLACPECGGNKKPTTHTYASYRAYLAGGTLILRCKTCSYLQRFKVIDGGFVEEVRPEELEGKE